MSEGARDAAGYWDALQLLAQQPQLPAFKALQSMLPRLAEQGQLLVLACALTQVCLPELFPLTPEGMPGAAISQHSLLKIKTATSTVSFRVLSRVNATTVCRQGTSHPHTWERA